MRPSNGRWPVTLVVHNSHCPCRILPRVGRALLCSLLLVDYASDCFNFCCLHDRCDSRIPPLRWMLAQIIDDARLEIARDLYRRRIEVLQHALDDLLGFPTAREQPIGIGQLLPVRHNFANTVLLQLALNKRDQLSRGHRIQLDAPVQQEFDFRSRCAIADQVGAA